MWPKKNEKMNKIKTKQKSAKSGIGGLTRRESTHAVKLF